MQAKEVRELIPVSSLLRQTMWPRETLLFLRPLLGTFASHLFGAGAALVVWASAAARGSGHQLIYLSTSTTQAHQSSPGCKSKQGGFFRSAERNFCEPTQFLEMRRCITARKSSFPWPHPGSFSYVLISCLMRPFTNAQSTSWQDSKVPRYKNPGISFTRWDSYRRSIITAASENESGLATRSKERARAYSPKAIKQN